jgi:hypothetical protein
MVDSYGVVVSLKMVILSGVEFGLGTGCSCVWSYDLGMKGLSWVMRILKWLWHWEVLGWDWVLG